MDDWREQYSIYAELPIFRRRVQKAHDRIAEAYETVPGVWGLSYSGGKDSTVLLDLVWSTGFRPPVLWQSYGDLETLPCNRRMVEAIKSRYGCEVIEREAPGELEIYRQVGHVFIEPETTEERRAVERWYREAFGRLSKFAREQGWIGQFLGMRMEESNQRRMLLGRRKCLYYTETRKLWTCCPLYDWSSKDIWAYIVLHDLPYAEIYDHPLFDRERARNDIVFLAGSGSIRHGQFVFWKTMYPQLWEVATREFPELRRYV